MKLLALLENITKGQSLATGTKMYAINNNIQVGEALRVFEQQAKSKGYKTRGNYKSVTEGATSHFFPPKALQYQKRYIFRGLYNPRESNIHK